MYNIKTLPVYAVDHLKESASKEGVKIYKSTTKLICMLDDNKVIGFANFKLYKNKAKMNGLYIEPQHRKKGLGTELTLTRLMILKGMGYKKIEANWDILSVGLHKNLGAKVINTKNGTSAKLIY
tara:strand:- start:446 stop:817 length:372 start_codon:yes stop_codon:yes gene_type:complete